MITDRIGRHEVLISINHKNYNFWEKKLNYNFEFYNKLSIMSNNNNLASELVS